MEKRIKVFKAIGDETRFKILLLLKNRNICAKGIANRLNISQAAVSQHIKILREAELVIGHKKGYFIMYKLNKDILDHSIELIKLLIKEEKNISLSGAKCIHSCKVTKKCCEKYKEE